MNLHDVTGVRVTDAEVRPLGRDNSDGVYVVREIIIAHNDGANGEQVTRLTLFGRLDSQSEPDRALAVDRIKVRDMMGEVKA